MPDVIVKAEKLQKAFGSTQAVKDFSFEAMAGEVFGVLGPNGAGKTTMMNMLSGLLHPDTGMVHIDGLSDPTRPEVRRSLGIAPQALAIYDELTAGENLRFMGKLQGLRGRKLMVAVDRGLEIAALAARRDSRAGTFSGGMKRRLNLACALIHEPKVVFLDEPTAGVDPQSRNHIFDRIEELREQGQTIIYTTHYMEEAQRLCHRVAIVDHGDMLATDTVDSLIQQHGGAYTITAQLAKTPENPESLPGVVEGIEWRLETEHPLQDVQDFLSGGAHIRDLQVSGPNLETVFLNLTGRSLRS